MADYRGDISVCLQPLHTPRYRTQRTKQKQRSAHIQLLAKTSTCCVIRRLHPLFSHTHSLGLSKTQKLSRRSRLQIGSTLVREAFHIIKTTTGTFTVLFEQLGDKCGERLEEKSVTELNINLFVTRGGNELLLGLSLHLGIKLVFIITFFLFLNVTLFFCVVKLKKDSKDEPPQL